MKPTNAAVPYPIRSITRLNRKILKAKGQNPTPRISPFSVSERSNSVAQSPIIIVLTMNPNAHATKAMKLPQNIRVSLDDEFPDPMFTVDID
jgi:hypothetical protein